MFSLEKEGQHEQRDLCRKGLEEGKYAVSFW